MEPCWICLKITADTRIGYYKYVCKKNGGKVREQLTPTSLITPERLLAALSVFFFQSPPPHPGHGPIFFKKKKKLSTSLSAVIIL